MRQIGDVWWLWTDGECFEAFAPEGALCGVLIGRRALRRVGEITCDTMRGPDVRRARLNLLHYVTEAVRD